ncbi:transposase, partial [Loigolactobacillus coryniformis]
MIIDQRQIRQVYLVCGKTDLRRGIDGLAGVVQDQFELDPYNQALYLFCGTRK